MNDKVEENVVDNDMTNDLKKIKSGKIEISKLVAKKLSDKMKKNF